MCAACATTQASFGIAASTARGFLRREALSMLGNRTKRETRPMPTLDATNRWPNYQEADFVIENYTFASGESLPELRLHYRTMGVARRDAAGKIVNGVLLL